MRGGKTQLETVEKEKFTGLMALDQPDPFTTLVSSGLGEHTGDLLSDDRLDRIGLLLRIHGYRGASACSMSSR